MPLVTYYCRFVVEYNFIVVGVPIAYWISTPCQNPRKNKEVRVAATDRRRDFRKGIVFRNQTCRFVFYIIVKLSRQYQSNMSCYIQHFKYVKKFGNVYMPIFSPDHIDAEAQDWSNSRSCSPCSFIGG